MISDIDPLRDSGLMMVNSIIQPILVNGVIAGVVRKCGDFIVQN